MGFYQMYYQNNLSFPFLLRVYNIYNELYIQTVCVFPYPPPPHTHTHLLFNWFRQKVSTHIFLHETQESDPAREDAVRQFVTPDIYKPRQNRLSEQRQNDLLSLLGSRNSRP